MRAHTSVISAKVSGRFVLVAATMLVALVALWLPVQAFALDANGNPVIVALGDSYSSGEGIEPFYDQNLPFDRKSKSESWLAHRSILGWPGRLEATGLDGIRHRMTTVSAGNLNSVDDVLSHYANDENFHFVASSGAEVTHLYTGQEKTCLEGTMFSVDIETDLPPQLDVFDDLEDATVDYVTLTLGGNDMGFTDIVTTAATNASILKPNALSDKLDAAWDKFENETRDDLKQAYFDIYEKSIPKKKTRSDTVILVAGYPALLDWGGNALFDAEEAYTLNSNIYEFNAELRNLVDECRNEKLKNIFFVDVAEAFFSHEAYSAEEYINKVILYQAGNQDLVKDIKRAPVSAYSIHPNQKGAQAYADCVQAMIDQIEAAKADGSDFGKYYDSQTISPKDDAQRDIALTLDVSGSMDGDPLKQTKIAALKFIESTATDNASANASISLVSYSNSANLEYDPALEAAVADMSWWDLAWASEDEQNAYRGSNYALRRKIRNLGAGGGTNIEDGLRLSYEQVTDSSADRRIIVLMSDGDATDGKTGDDLVEYAQSIKDRGVLIYALGFYQSTSDGANVLERIASDGCYYQIDDANQLRYFFGDIADALNGTKFMYVRIACPVDVRVSTGTGTLDSSSGNLNMRTDFGSLTFAYPDGETDDPVKVLRLKEGQSYDVEIAGTGTGTMDYTIGFVDEQGAYSDMRNFENVSISPKTRAAGVAETGDVSVLRVDNDGDGNYDDIYQATANSAAQKVDNMWIVQGVTAGACLLVALIALLYGLYCKKAWRVGVKRKI